MQLICKFQNGQKKKKPKKRIQLDNKYALPYMAKTTESAQLSGSAKKPEYPGGYSDSLARQKGFEPPTFRLGVGLTVYRTVW